MVKLLPKKFTSSLGDITKQFLQGVWYGMGPDPRKIVKSPKEVKNKKLRRSR